MKPIYKIIIICLVALGAFLIGTGIEESSLAAVLMGGLIFLTGAGIYLYNKNY